MPLTLIEALTLAGLGLEEQRALFGDSPDAWLAALTGRSRPTVADARRKLGVEPLAKGHGDHADEDYRRAWLRRYGHLRVVLGRQQADTA